MSSVQFKSKVGSLIAAAREKRELSQFKVAVLLGMEGESGQFKVSAWERGRTPVRVEDKARASLAELLSLKPDELEALLREDETARARFLSRRKAGQAVRRQYESPTPSAKASAAPKAAARPPESAAKLREAVQSHDTVSMIVSAIAANDPALSGVPSGALIRLVRRFVVVQQAITAP